MEEASLLATPLLESREGISTHRDGKIRMFAQGVLVAEAIHGTSQVARIADTEEQLLRAIEHLAFNRASCVGSQSVDGLLEDARSHHAQAQNVTLASDPEL